MVKLLKTPENYLKGTYSSTKLRSGAVINDLASCFPTPLQVLYG